ncbi:MAG: MOSC domain-containing protein, partial [Vicinamibacterales bacterium]
FCVCRGDPLGSPSRSQAALKVTLTGFGYYQQSSHVGQLLKIWVKRFRRSPMDAVSRATVIAGRGIVGDANQGSTRQVTILSDKDWSEVTSGPGTPDPIVRRANLLVSDVDLLNSRNKILQIGSVRIRLLGETRPCERMEEAKAGLKAAMSVPYGGGAFGEILDDGEIAIGDSVTLHEITTSADHNTAATAVTTDLQRHREIM